MAEALADDLGFCEYHALYLTNAVIPAPPHVGRSYAVAIERIEPLLHRSVVDERCQRLLFSATHRCPACATDEFIAGKLLGLLSHGWLQDDPDVQATGALCWQHGQALFKRLPLLVRGPVLQRYLEDWDAATQALTTPSAMSSVTEALARLGVRPGWFSRMSSLQQPFPQRGLSDPDHCPICEALREAEQHWLRSLQWATAHADSDCLWLFAPSCARHLAAAARVSSDHALWEIALFAQTGRGEQLRQQLAAIVHELIQAQERRPLWYRRRKRTRQPAGRPAARRFVLRCQGCEAEAIALERATARFISLLRRDQGRQELGLGHGLCLRHLAHVLPVAPLPNIRPLLSELHATRLRTLHTALTQDPGCDTWHRAVYRFSGGRTSPQDGSP